ncbi:hypothetical protein RHGRI_034027 [Rhododendron griersonianum]|uniref:Pentatricopeptide repeat-containing protein n=1 Tax=Rhododendron griersonianum TaxID=479676 RepID=A0AAV6HZF7_9ERIC|nr:hypothetical protein RHGRI_034027 [Rhododendron griersonianum]
MKLVDLKPSQATFVSIISACSHMGLVDQGHALFKSMTLDYGMEPSPDSFGSLVDLLSRNGLLQDAKHIIEAMPFKPWPAIWRSLLNGCRIHGDRELGEWAARKLCLLVLQNDAAYILLSKVYSEDGDWEGAAKLLFTTTPTDAHPTPSTPSPTTIAIDAVLPHVTAAGLTQAAFSLFHCHR